MLAQIRGVGRYTAMLIIYIHRFPSARHLCSRAGLAPSVRSSDGRYASGKIAKVAIAREILTLAYYGLRDGEIRCLARRSRASAREKLAA